MLTKRLQKIVDILPQCKVLADVGCDHGYVGLEALKGNKAERVIFVDVSKPSLQKARQNCGETLKTRADFLCQDGLQQIECDCAVIAGMGGLEIMSVLKGAKVLPQALVLQPMRNQSDVRLFLQKDYEIVSDEKFLDGKFYDLILATKSANGCKLTDDEIHFGKSNLLCPSEDFVSFLKKEKQEYQNILQQCQNAEIVEKYNAVERILHQLKGEKR